MAHTRVENIYFKQGGMLMSGISLPKDADGKIRDKHFVCCDFHPNCGSAEFVNCIFDADCDGLEYLTKRS